MGLLYGLLGLGFGAWLGFESGLNQCEFWESPSNPYRQGARKSKGTSGLGAAVCGARYGKLSYQQKKRLPAGAFALSGRRYPMPDSSHASNAKARARQALNRGTLSESEYRTVVRKANKILNRCGGV